MVKVLGLAVLLGYLQASIAKMQDHPKPSLTILDFRFWIEKRTDQYSLLRPASSVI